MPWKEDPPAIDCRHVDLRQRRRQSANTTSLRSQLWTGLLWITKIYAEAASPMAKTHYARINDQGEIVLPHRVARELGISPGDKIRIEPNGHGLYVHPPVHTLKRVYVELTNRCNLNCSTCMRNVWDVQYGQMSMDVFEQILSSLDQAHEKPELFFGGYGEPLSHPKVLRMIERAKNVGIVCP